MKKFILLLLDKRRAVTLLLTMLLLLGVILIKKIPVSFFPKTSKPTYYINISGTGMTAEDMHEDFNSKIQGALTSVPFLESHEVRYYSSGFIQIILNFPWRMDLDKAESESENFKTSIKSIFPSSFNDPALYYSDDGSSGYLAVALYSPKLSNAEIYDQAVAILKDDINSVPGIDFLDISPIRQLKAEIIIDPNALLSYALNIDTVISRISSEYKTSSLGSFRDGRRRFSLRTVGSIDSIFELKNLPIATISNRTLFLHDIAEVNVFYDLPNNVYRVNGDPAIMIVAQPKQGANIKNMAEDVLERIHNKLPAFSDTVEADVLVNPAAFIDIAIENVLHSAITGAVLAMIVTLAFLGIFRNTFIVISAIPISIIYAFIFLYNLDVSINLISLSGLAISVGLSLDAAIVIMENIHRHRLMDMQQPLPITLEETIANATAEVAQPVFMSALTSIAVFLPLRFTSPLASAILGDLALTIILTLAASVFVSFTAIPILSYYLFRSRSSLRKQKDNSIAPTTEPPETIIMRLSGTLMGFLSGGYRRILEFFLQSKIMSGALLIITALLFILSLFLVRKIPFSIIEEPASASLIIDIRHSDMDNINDFILAVEPIEQQIVDLLGEENIDARFFSTRNNSQGQIFLNMINPRIASNSIAQLEEALISDTTWTFSVEPYNPAKMQIPRTYALRIAVSGAKKQEIFNYMDRIADQAQQIRRHNDHRAYTWVGTAPMTAPTNELRFRLRDEVSIEIPEYSKNRLNILINNYINGFKPITFVLENGQEIRPIFRFPEITSAEDIGNILVPYQDKALPISHFFDISEHGGISNIIVVDQIEITEVRAMAQQNIPLTELAQFEKTLQERITENIAFNPGYSYTFLDATALIKETIISLRSALIISVLLVFMILTVQFNSFLLSLIILIAIPSGIMGSILSLYIAKSTLSINSMLGMILLGGISINNSLLIVDFFINDVTSSSKKEAIIRASLLRFSPILSTTVTTLLGMLPIALALGDGSNVIQPLGIAVTGGLALSTCFTLLTIPVILSFVSIKGKGAYLK
ncbi:efflux RND transporter permease subunit [Entomospira nematocerorum]|uniref:Efflux RND transporter permease subunit n=1 Tax=Entomospira nematocerorum TaxID=2719987 RepID=A0A968GAS8_9SPIO|nr:efflux RND transporter permease subunit [Entomospira nematocera]NIZ46460.1 efflux RND transporter permease subunit [Entomospira nematocera]WDI33738.1 efflux RND transporter permease subunit [Entomospira nematocera]